MWPFRQLRRRAHLKRRLIPEATWRQAVRDRSIFAGLAPAEETRLRELSTLFLHEKHIIPSKGYALTDDLRLAIATQACLPILNLGFDWYDDWNTVIAYPGLFGHRQTHEDQAGVVHQWHEILSGEAWVLGPVILSAADVDQSGRGEGYNVVIHEMAHKLDMLNGDSNGFPPLHRGMDRRAWTAAFSAAYDALCDAVDGGYGAAIDPYAAESPGEFFAVVSEYFFETPDHLEACEPEVYCQLRDFYRQDPAARIAGTRVAPVV